ncbi:coilin [Tympanuchus pallidicinctus]|uniref:coilin n=1 Tax=Tympanuchus pallidicinctus TaxID=109042 RepID=UPI0022873AE6|nr:coilin [Tympanuchus pallidicinctus]
MAATGGAPVRLRLQFDFPPPGSPGCALCWLLLEPGQARLVTDLLSIIRHRFGFSRRARLSLFLDGALLPPTESARLVRDNDALRVTLEEIAAEGCEEADDDFCAPKDDRKRHKRRQKAQGMSRSGEEKHQKEKKKSKRNPECSSGREDTTGDVSDTRKKSKKRKRREENSGMVPRSSEGKKGSADRPPKLQKAQREERPAAREKDGQRAAKAAHGRADGSATLMAAKSTSKNLIPEVRKQRVGTSESSSASSDSDSSESNVKHSKSSYRPAATALPRDKAQTAMTAVARNQMSNAEHCSKTAVSKNAKKSQSSSSDSDSSSEDERAAAQGSTAKQALPNSAAAAQTGPTGAPKARSSSSESDSSNSETLIIKKPAANAGLSNSIATNGSKQSPAGIQGPAAGPGRGRGRAAGEGNFWRGPRGRGFRGMVRGRGRGESPGFFYSYSSEGQKQRQLHEAVTNTSVPVQNAVDVPKRDYSVLPLLAAPPQVGERIAFKRLELNENYSPEVSSYKEGRIISWNADKKQIELEILSSSASQIAKEPGKFDLVYQSADGAELIEYAVPQDTKITESWDSLIEPRLIVEPPVNGSGIENGAV